MMKLHGYLENTNSMPLFLNILLNTWMSSLVGIFGLKRSETKAGPFYLSNDGIIGGNLLELFLKFSEKQIS